MVNQTYISKSYNIGWDVGGAHLKAALIDMQGQLLKVCQVPCPLWRGLVHLNAAIQLVMQDMMNDCETLKAPSNLQNMHHFITMTGELVDLFAHRKQGVAEISAAMQHALTGEKWFYAMQIDASLPAFVQIPTESESWMLSHWQMIASANWHASAQLLAQYVPNGLLIDIGSTTSDFIVVKQHTVITKAFTDAARMQAQTLIYTGIVRTPVMALGHKVMFEGTETTVAAEYFATTADVYRLTGDLIEMDDMADTADNAEKTVAASAKRLARMIGHDGIDREFKSWQGLAEAFKGLQLARLINVAHIHLQSVDMQNGLHKPVILGAGVGRFLVKEIAHSLHLPYIDVSGVLNHLLVNDDLLTNLSAKSDAGSIPLLNAASASLPAVAVAILGKKHLIEPQSPLAT